MIGTNDHGTRVCSPMGRSTRRTGRWAGIGVLVMTLGALALWLVYASRTQPADALRTSVIPSAPSPVQRTIQLRSSVMNNGAPKSSRVGNNAPRPQTVLSFTRHGLIFTSTESRPTPVTAQKPAFPHRPLRLDFVGSNPGAYPQWLEPTPLIAGSFTDALVRDMSGSPFSPTLRYRDLWPGIDLLFSITANQLRSILLVKPGADPNQIQFAYYGITAVRRTEEGQIEVTTPSGGFTEEISAAYQESRHLTRLQHLRNGISEDTSVPDQEREGQQMAVTATYTLESSGNIRVSGIHIGTYDPNSPLIIERVVRYPGTIGRSDTDAGLRLAPNYNDRTQTDPSSTLPMPPHP